MHDAELCPSVWKIYGDGTAIPRVRNRPNFPLNSPKLDEALQRVNQSSLFAGRYGRCRSVSFDFFFHFYDYVVSACKFVMFKLCRE